MLPEAPIAGWGGDTRLIPHPPTRRLWRLDFPAIGACHLAPSASRFGEGVLPQIFFFYDRPERNFALQLQRSAKNISYITVIK